MESQAKSIKVPLMSVHSKNIKKVKCAMSEQNTENMPCLKKKTVLLNEMLTKNNGSYRTGNMLVVRMIDMNQMEMFKNAVKTQL